MAAQYKHCPGCCEKGETLPANEFDKDKTTADGLAVMCIECTDYGAGFANEDKPEVMRKAKKPVTKKAPAKEPEKKCPTCKKVKAFSLFTKDKTKADGRAAYCKECKNIAQKEYRNNKTAEKAVMVAKQTQENPKGGGILEGCKLEKTKYYDAGGVKTISIIRAKLTPEQYMGFLLGCAIKYSCRANHKNDFRRDMEKASTYAKWAAEFSEEEKCRS